MPRGTPRDTVDRMGTLSEWLDEYRSLATDGFRRPLAVEPADEVGEELLAPADRLRDTTPRWLTRAGRVGYGPPTQL